MNNKTITKIFLSKISLVCFLTFVSTGNASPLVQKIPTNTIKLNLSLNAVNTKPPVFIDFKKMKPQNLFEFIKSKYLTLYSSKTEKVKATYVHGAYAINYTQKW